MHLGTSRYPVAYINCLMSYIHFVFNYSCSFFFHAVNLLLVAFVMANNENKGQGHFSQAKETMLHSCFALYEDGMSQVVALLR